MDRYNKIQLLGKGRYGIVYLCERKHNHQKIVVKEIDSQINGVDAAKNEVKILKSLKSPNVLEYYDSFYKNEILYIVMEYASWGNLHDYLAKQGNLLPQSKVLSIFCQILMGLEHIHSKKIIHRDLKCANICLSGLNGEIVKLGDFGISKILESHNSSTKTVIGTTNYLAPEVCDGQPYNNKSDIWALGCILFELCSLRRMFDGTIANIVTSIKSEKRKQISTKHYVHELQLLINDMTEPLSENRPAATNLIAHSFLFPFITKLILRLGNLTEAAPTA